jgi:hypothetical protein
MSYRSPVSYSYLKTNLKCARFHREVFVLQQVCRRRTTEIYSFINNASLIHYVCSLLAKLCIPRIQQRAVKIIPDQPMSVCAK